MINIPYCVGVIEVQIIVKTQKNNKKNTGGIPIEYIQPDPVASLELDS